MKEIIQRQRQMMDEYHLDALVTMSPENITYVTGTAIPTQLTVRQRQVIHILTPTQGPEVIVVNIEEPIMRAQSWIDQDRIVSYNEFTQTPIRLAAETLRKMGAARGRLGFELSYLPATDMEILRRSCRRRRSSTPTRSLRKCAWSSLPSSWSGLWTWAAGWRT